MRRKKLYRFDAYGNRLGLAPWYVRLYYWLTGKGR